MRPVDWLKIILFGILASVVFAFAELLIDGLVRPKRELLMLDLTLLVYLLVLMVSTVCGLVISLAALLSKSRTITLVVAIVTAVTISTGLIRGAYETYADITFFDAPMFYADIIQVVINLSIYPLVGWLIWKLFRDKLLARS
jgi:hypothetical protein